MEYVTSHQNIFSKRRTRTNTQPYCPSSQFYPSISLASFQLAVLRPSAHAQLSRPIFKWHTPDVLRKVTEIYDRLMAN